MCADIALVFRYISPSIRRRRRRRKRRGDEEKTHATLSLAFDDTDHASRFTAKHRGGASAVAVRSLYSQRHERRWPSADDAVPSIIDATADAHLESARLGIVVSNERQSDQGLFLLRRLSMGSLSDDGCS